jgi:glycosyltransferase involved in cell wall biosynthesis
MTKPIKILRLIARLNIGGPAIQAVNLSTQLSGNHYQTLLVCGSLSPGEGDMAYLAREKGVEPLVIRELGRDISLFSDLRSFLVIRKTIKHFQPDILHTHTAKAGTIGRLAAFSLRIPFASSKKVRMVHTFHGHTFHSYFSPLKTFFFIQAEKMLSRFTDKIIVLSKQQKKDICSIYKIAVREKVRTIPLGFDLSRFGNIDSAPKESIEKNTNRQNFQPLRIGTIGRLTAVKNHFMLFETINCLRLSGKIDNFKFFIVGDGELKKEFVEKANELELMNSIVFKGWQKDMPSVYAQLDAVALTSKNEGTPVALIEAMASCRPVVAAAVGGVPELLGRVKEKKPEGFQIAERGLMVQSGDAEALAQALLYLSENRGAMQPMIRNAKEFVLTNYGQDRLLNDIKMLYGELLG